MLEKKRRKSYTTVEEKRFLGYTETQLQEAASAAASATTAEDRHMAQGLFRELIEQREKLEQNIAAGTEEPADTEKASKPTRIKRVAAAS